jgi:hypothetical protein
MVIIWPQESYAVGDVVAFKMEFSPGMVVPILHRVIGRDASGNYLIKGDAATGTDSVRPEDVMGRMTLGIPFLGFVGGAGTHLRQLRETRGRGLNLTRPSVESGGGEIT